MYATKGIGINPELLSSNPSTDVVSLENVGPQVLESMVEFVYTAEVDMCATLVKELGRSCKQLQLISLKEACDLFISDMVEPSNAMGLYMYARRQQMALSIDAAEKCLMSAPEEVLRLALKAEYQELTQDALIQWISSDDLEVPTEDMVFQIVEKWVTADSSRKKENILE